MKNVLILAVGAVALVAVSVLATKIVLERQGTKTALPERTTTTTPTQNPAPAEPATPAAQTPTDPNVAVFTSTKLGVSLQYLKSQSGQAFGAMESGNKVYVYMTNTKAETGQWVEVFSKDPAQPLADAVKQKFLPSTYKESDCFVKKTADQPGLETVQIRVPMVANGDMEALSAAWEKCPATYTTQNGMSYFVMDPAHPSKFAYLSIGQYLIPGPVADKGWQATLKFL